MTRKVLLVTGASRGIGAATAILAAQAGWCVAVHYHQNEAAAQSVCDAIMAKGGDARIFAADLAVESDIQDLFAQVLKVFERLDGLVNNVGITPLLGRVDQMDFARLTEIFTTNIAGAFVCAGEAVRAMSTRYGHDGGVIVNVSSRAAVLGSPNRYVDYDASKAALDALTIGLAKEVAPDNIRLTPVIPGVIDKTLIVKNGFTLD